MRISEKIKQIFWKIFKNHRCLFCNSKLQLIFQKEDYIYKKCMKCETKDVGICRNIAYYCDIDSTKITSYCYFFIYKRVEYQLAHHLYCSTFTNKLLIWDVLGKPALIDISVNKIVSVKDAKRYLDLMVFQ